MRKVHRAVLALAARILAVLAAVQLAATPALAGVEGEMNSFFNSAGAAANVTGPSAYSGQAAGYYSGGSIWARFPQKSVNPVNIQLPHARGGCGGIDLFGGSFSFINADEFVAMLKATANNAIGFAFQLAIDSISAEIGGVMKDMAHRVQALNQFNMSSCEAAQQAIGNIWPKMAGASSTICQTLGAQSGRFSDAAKARHGCNENGETNAVLDSVRDDPAAEPVKPRNYTWNALKSRGGGTFDDSYAEFLMSMVGTVIYNRPSRSDAVGVYHVIPPASWDTYTALLDGTAGRNVQILKCNDGNGADQCLDVGSQTLTVTTANSFRARVMRMMTSMADKIRTNAPLTTEEISLLGMSSIPLYKILVVNEAASFRLADSDMAMLSEIVAVDVLMAQIDRMLDDISRSQTGTQYVSTEEMRSWRDQIATVKTELNRKSQAMANNLSNTYRIIERTQMLEATLKNAMSPQLTASLKFGRGLSAQGLR
jgi:conjugative transfer pilus assembly protein TraH